jgi:hypothetical protein
MKYTAFGILSLTLMAISHLQAANHPEDKPTLLAKQEIANARLLASRLAKEKSARNNILTARESLKISGDSSDCLASRKASGECLVTVGAFNQALSSVEPESDSAALAASLIARIRHGILAQKLNSEYLEDHARLLDHDPARKAQGIANEKNRNQMIREQWGDSLLSALYARHAQLFQPHEERKYSIIASSDTSEIDSLNLLGEETKHLTWVNIADTLLPSEIQAQAKQMRNREMIRLAFPYGAALLRFNGVRKSRKVSFQQALPTLAAIASLPEPDSAGDALAAYNYFRNHPTEFRNPDTITVDADLAPPVSRPETLNRKPKYLRLQDHDLPGEVRDWIMDVDPVVREGDGIGPEFLGMGKWTIKVVQVRRGQGQRPFDKVESAIHDRLVKSRTSIAVASAVKDASFKSKAGTESLIEMAIDSSLAPSEAEIEKRLAQENKSTQADSSKADAEKAEMEANKYVIRMRLLEEKRQQSYAEWENQAIEVKSF